MSDNQRVACPSCQKGLGGLTREGEVRLRLAITLVKSDGTVHGPCSHCGADVVVSTGGRADEAVAKALTGPVRVRGSLVLDVRALQS